jgi:hypothetical protein
MESNVQELDYINPSSLDELSKIEYSKPNNLSKLSSNNSLDSQVSKISRQITYFWEHLPGYILKSYDEYKLLIISFTLLIVVLITLKILLAVTGAINEIPLVSPFFELIGIGYVIWFALRYFLKSETRQELAGKLDSFKKRIAGDNII